eukprot:459561-Amorphochlora_amoeboformis.AAC.1
MDHTRLPQSLRSSHRGSCGCRRAGQRRLLPRLFAAGDVGSEGDGAVDWRNDRVECHGGVSGA